MKTRHALTHLVGALALTAMCYVSTGFAAEADQKRRPYARVLATSVEFTEDGADSGFGVLFEYASPSEDQPNGDLVIQTGWIGWDQGETIDGIELSADADLIPALLGYRHRLPFGSESRLRLELGASIGAVYSRVSVRATDGFSTGSASANDWSFAWAGEAALVYAVPGRAWEVIVGYKYLSADAGSVDIDGDRYDLGSIDAHVISAGIGWSW